MFTKLLSGLLPSRSALSWLPSQCRVCHAWPTQPLCEACVHQFAQPQPRCDTCAMPLPGDCRRCGACLKQAPPLDRCLAAVAYSYPWSTLIQDYKFHAEPGLVRSFATLLRATPWVESELERTDLVLPMPLSNARLTQRGYNQAWLLAKQLAPHKTSADVLLRIKDTPAQHTLPRAQRLTVLKQAFAVEPLHAGKVQNQRVMLVDDVMTTGASLFSAARVLKAAGARHVSALVIARTE